MGHAVRVLTLTRNSEPESYAFPVIRNPGLTDLLATYLWCDVFIQQGPSLRLGWPTFLSQKRTLLVHHIWLREAMKVTLFGRDLQQLLLYCANNLAVSQALADSLPVRSEVIENPYDCEIFKILNNGERSNDFLFIGRLIPEKGAELLIQAIAILQNRGISARAKIAGSGPRLNDLNRQAEAFGVSTKVDFLGPIVGRELVALLNRHKVLVVPSKWEEPFGIVALEAIACGCFVVGSAGGGLREAIGPCGVLFPRGDAIALADVLQQIIENQFRIQSSSDVTSAHLAKHRPSIVAGRLLDLARCCCSL